MLKVYNGLLSFFNAGAFHGTGIDRQHLERQRKSTPQNLPEASPTYLEINNRLLLRGQEFPIRFQGYDCGFRASADPRARAASRARVASRARAASGARAASRAQAASGARAGWPGEWQRPGGQTTDGSTNHKKGLSGGWQSA